MKNIFIEGIQGMGKSTLVNGISREIPALHICREGDYSPVDLAWCTWMTKKEYDAVLEKYHPIREEIIKNTVKEQEHYIVSYTKIITDIPGFHKDLENYEVYNGRKTWQELKEIIIGRFQKFSESGYLFECALFQNIMEDLILFHMRSDEEIMGFYRELFEILSEKDFKLFYLYSDKLEESIKVIRKERCDSEGNELWHAMMLEYLATSPYGKKHGYGTSADLILHLKHRQELELAVIKDVFWEKAEVLPAKKYDLKKITEQIKTLA